MKNKVLLNAMALLAVVITGLLILGEIPFYYRLLPVLTGISAFVFLITSILIGNRPVTIGYALIFALSFIRYCVHPLLMLAGDFSSIMKMNISNNTPNGVLLMVYELVSIYVAMIMAARKYKYVSVNVRNIQCTKKSLSVIWILLLFLMVAIIIRPDLKNLFMSIFNIGQDEFTHAARVEEQAVGSLIRIISTLFSFVFMTVRIILPVYMIGWLSKKKFSKFWLVLVALLFVFLEFLFITATFAESIISALVVILAVGKINKSLMDKMMKIAPVFAVSIIVFFFYTRYQLSNTLGSADSTYAGINIWQYLSSLFNAYFTGIDNVSATFNMPRDTRLSHFLASMQVTIPFNTTIFGRAGEILPTLYNQSNNVMGQIPSTIGNGYYYFGFLLAPLFSLIFAFYAIKFDSLAQGTNDFWRYIVYTLITILFSLGLGMYNEVITLSYIFGWAIPILLITSMFDRNVSGKLVTCK